MGMMDSVYFTGCRNSWALCTLQCNQIVSQLIYPTFNSQFDRKKIIIPEFISCAYSTVFNMLTNSLLCSLHVETRELFREASFNMLSKGVKESR